MLFHREQYGIYLHDSDSDLETSSTSNNGKISDWRIKEDEWIQSKDKSNKKPVVAFGGHPLRKDRQLKKR